MKKNKIKYLRAIRYKELLHDDINLEYWAIAIIISADNDICVRLRQTGMDTDWIVNSRTAADKKFDEILKLL